MSDIVCKQQQHIMLITLNRVSKHNAFDNALLAELQVALDQAQENSNVRVIVLKANGQHFSAGADATWMQRMARFSEDENLADAKVLARVMYTLYNSTKPTIAMVQGAAYGGGAGLVAACDVAIAAQTARFCFSEVKLGLIPAVISPYVIKAMGERSAKALFMSAEQFDAQRAYELNLVHHCVPEDELLSYTLNYAEQMTHNAPQATNAAKFLVHQVADKPIDDALQQFTASLIAKQRVSREGQLGLRAFLNKETPNWN